jgi:hypothetical protein
MNTISYKIFKRPYIVAIFFLSCLACKKSNPKTPDDFIVRSGNQAFGAYLNGQPWVADYSDPGSGIGPLSITMYDFYLPGLIPRYNYIWATASKANESMEIYLPPPLVPGRVILNTNTFPYPSVIRPPAYGMYHIYNPSKRYLTNNTVTGFVDIIACDTILRTIEALFEFEAINTSTGEKVKITNGYFKK